jgi:hypothetical protein
MKALFVTVGAVAVFFIFWQARRSADAQDRNTALLQEIRKLQDRPIPPPIVNVQPQEVVPAPPGSSSEDAAKKLQAGERKRKLVSALSVFIDRANQIQSDFLKTDNVTEIMQRAQGWESEVEQYLQKNGGTDGQSFAIQFHAAHGNAMEGMPNNHSVAGDVVWLRLEGKKDSLSSIISEIRKGH